MEATLDPTTGDVKVTTSEKEKNPSKDRAIKELLALKEAYFPLKKTPGGKQFRVYQVAGTSLFRVGWVDGGVLPKELTGSYTKGSLAEEAIKEYLDKVWAVALDGA